MKTTKPRKQPPMGSDPLKNLLKNGVVALWVAVAAVALLGLVELGLRLTYPGEVAAAGGLDPIAYQFNPDYGVALKPNQHKFFQRKEKNGGYISRWQTNAEGFRGPPLQDNPALRVMVYGDSNIQARFSGQRRSFSAQLAARLADLGIEDAEVINAGVVGFGPDQNLIRFSQQADRFKPDLVIFQVFADNDLGDIIRNRLFEFDATDKLVRSTYPLEPDKDLTESTKHRIRDTISGLLVVQKSKTLLQDWLGWPDSADATEQKHPSLTERREKRINFMLERAEQEFAVYQAGEARQFSHFADHYDFDVALFPQSESSRQKIRLMEAVLTRAYQAARERGIKFLLLIEPSVIDLTDGNALMNPGFLSRYADYRPENLSAIFERIATDNSIPFVNLLPVFSRNEPASLFFSEGDDHWTDRGQALAARETARYLIDTRMLTATE